jgi:putative ABC transport system substrate-binding protein
MVQDGGLATYGIDYTVLGKETAEMVADILEGKSPSTMAVKKMSDMKIYINENTANTLGIKIPESILSKATTFPQK